MLMEIKSINLRIIDSSNSVQGLLKELKELPKGFFPHSYSATENQNYFLTLNIVHT
jgi:hypothetical protein